MADDLGQDVARLFDRDRIDVEVRHRADALWIDVQHNDAPLAKPLGKLGRRAKQAATSLGPLSKPGRHGLGPVHSPTLFILFPFSEIIILFKFQKFI